MILSNASLLFPMLGPSIANHIILIYSDQIACQHLILLFNFKPILINWDLRGTSDSPKSEAGVRIARWSTACTCTQLTCHHHHLLLFSEKYIFPRCQISQSFFLRITKSSSKEAPYLWIHYDLLLTIFLVFLTLDHLHIHPILCNFCIPLSFIVYICTVLMNRAIHLSQFFLPSLRTQDY